MNKRLTNIILIAIILLIGFIALSVLRKRLASDQEGYVMVPQSFLDSLVAVAEMKPDTIIRDTTIIIKEIQYIDRPLPPGTTVSVDPVITAYRDSIVNDEIAAWVNFETFGTLKDISWEYRPTIREILTEIKVPAPYPVPYEKKVPQTGVYGSIGAGMGSENIIFSGEVKYLDKKGRIYGLEVGNFVNSYIKVEYGIKF
jgi:hypothetical protein